MTTEAHTELQAVFLKQDETSLLANQIVELIPADIEGRSGRFEFLLSRIPDLVLVADQVGDLTRVYMCRSTPEALGALRAKFDGHKEYCEARLESLKTSLLEIDALLAKGSTPAAPVRVAVQLWREYERGWGSRYDGFSLHLKMEDIRPYSEEMYRRERVGIASGVIPDEYSVAEGEPYWALVEYLDREPSFEAMAEEKGVWGVGKRPAREA